VSDKKRKYLFQALGPLAFIIIQMLNKPENMTPEAFQVLAVTAWVAIWWVTEAINIAVTALLVIVLFPLTGALDISSTTAAFGHKYIFLYIGGFMLAIAIEKWNLHRRIALNIISLIGTNVTNIILGFMVATAFLSMWISNTATSVMMLPIGMAIVTQFKSGSNNSEKLNKDFGKALMLSIAYSASIGGIGTLIGTPPNLVFAGIVSETYQIEISFMKWFMFGAPISVILLFLSWKYLTKYAFKFRGANFPGGKEEINRLKKELGPISKEEKYVLAVFSLTAFCWITRSFILQKINPNIDDTIIAMTAGISLFIIPSSNSKKAIINWKEAVKMPWGIIMLFGGGMALAQAFQTTGLALWIGSQLTLIEGMSLILVILILIASINFLTEMTSNLATTAMLLPILAPLALAMNLHPYMLMVSATLAASCAFMLPVATPPNAVVFGSGYLHIPDMIRTGIWMNVLSIIIITLMTYFLLPIIWEIIPTKFPDLWRLE
jgi:sodium-dependent dicarboxylate transporter 2/3/5